MIAKLTYLEIRKKFNLNPKDIGWKFFEDNSIKWADEDGNPKFTLISYNKDSLEVEYAE